MREIKFRARWRDTLKKVIDFNDEYTIAACEDDAFIVEQYTGLKDKNGVDIYEGDMISFGDGKATIEYSNQDFCFVFWHNIDEEWYSLAYLKGLKNFEVIGNIHEHKHLLK